MATKEHWDRVWKGAEPFVVDEQRMHPKPRHAFFRLMGDLQGRNVLDIGCGDGVISTYLAQRGAQVTAIDPSPEAVTATNALAEFNGVGSRVNAQVLDAMEVDRFPGQFDLVVGKLVLHHIEPFEDFAPVLAQSLAPGGRGVFYENSARNPLLMFFRRNVVGRYGVPKHGDEEEHPLEIREIQLLEREFPEVRVHHAEFVCLELINVYFFRNKKIFTPILELMKGLDRLLYHCAPPLRRYSYHQIVEVQNGSAG